MPIQLIPAVTPAPRTVKTVSSKQAAFKKALKGRHLTVAKKSTAGVKPSSGASRGKGSTGIPPGALMTPGMPAVPPQGRKPGVPGPVGRTPVPSPGQRGAETPVNQGETHPYVPQKGPSALVRPVPSGPKVVAAPGQESATPLKTASVRLKTRIRPLPSKVGSKAGGLTPPTSPNTAPVNATLVASPATVTASATRGAQISPSAPMASPAVAPVGSKAPVVPRGWRIQPTSIRNQVGETATRWKVTPPGRLRHTMEIAVSNAGNTWQVDVKAHHQDGAWLTGALSNTTPLTQSFGQHGWDLSQVSLWLGQPGSSGNSGQFFGQSGHSPPEPHYGGYGSASVRSESRWTGGPQDGIDYTA